MATTTNEDLLYTNLLLLGFDPTRVDEQYKVKCSREMFRRANVAAMEVVTHFLMLKLDPHHEDLLKDIWPIMERQQAHSFKKVVFAVFSQLEKEGYLPLNSVRLSHLQTCSGERFVEMLKSVSMHTLRVVMERDFGVTPPKPTGVPPSAFLSTATGAAKLRVVQAAQRFADEARTISSIHAKWRSFATDVHNESCRVAEMENKYECRRQVVEKGLVNAEDAIAHEYIEKIKDGLNRIEGYITGTNAQRMGVLEDAVLGRSPSHRIEGVLLSLSSSVAQSVYSVLDASYNNAGADTNALGLLSSIDLDLDTMRQNLSQITTTAAAPGSPSPPAIDIDISAVLKVWSVCLRILESKLHSVTYNFNTNTGNNMQSSIDGLEEEVRLYEKHRSQCRALVSELSRLLSHVTVASNELRDELNLNGGGGDGIGVDGMQLKLVPPTPAVKVNLDVNYQPATPTPASQSQSQNAATMNMTPFVMERLAMSVRRAANVFRERDSGDNEVNVNAVSTPTPVSATASSRSRSRSKVLDADSLDNTLRAAEMSLHATDHLDNSSSQDHSFYSPVSVVDGVGVEGSLARSLALSLSHMREASSAAPAAAKATTTKTKTKTTDPLDELANQLISNVMSSPSPLHHTGADVLAALDDPLHAAFESSAAFLTKSQIPRTPLRIPPIKEEVEEEEDIDATDSSSDYEIVIKGQKNARVPPGLDLSADTVPSEPESEGEDEGEGDSIDIDLNVNTPIAVAINSNSNSAHLSRKYGHLHGQSRGLDAFDFDFATPPPLRGEGDGEGEDGEDEGYHPPSVRWE